MIKIAVCDAKIKELAATLTLVKQFVSHSSSEIEYIAFDNAMDLVSSIQLGGIYDIIIMDVIMPMLNGIDASKEIRQLDENVKIIFLTGSPAFAIASYEVAAYYYMLKPVCKDRLFRVLEQAIEQICRSDQESILVKCKSRITRIPLDRLEFLEVVDKTIFYHLADGSSLEGYGKIGILEKELSGYPQFVKPHRSYLVHLEYVEVMTQREMKMSSRAVLPIARDHYGKVKDAYLNYSIGRWNEIGFG